MMKTLDKYQRCYYGSLEASSRPANNETTHHHQQSTLDEYFNLKARVDFLQRSQRNLLGEDLGPLNTKDLEQLEHQLETSLERIRSTKTQYMFEQLADLQRKEQKLIEVNKSLKKKLEETQTSAQNQINAAWGWETEAAATATASHSISIHRRAVAVSTSNNSEAFFQIGSPTLQIGYNSAVSSSSMGMIMNIPLGEAGAAASSQNVNNNAIFHHPVGWMP